MVKFTDVVQDRYGNALQGASVTVRVANLITPGTGALASIYVDSAGVTPVSGSVLSTDVNGRFSFYSAPGQYDLTVTGTGISTVTLGGVDVADALNFTAPGTFTDTNQNSYVTSIINGVALGSEYAGIAGGHHATEATVGAVAVPVSSTAWQANGVSGYTTNASTYTQAVGIFGASRSYAAGAPALGANFVASGTTGIGTAGLTCTEFDFNPMNTTDTGSGVTIVYGSTVQSTAANGLVISTAQPGTTRWNAGLVLSESATSGGATSPGISLQPVASGSTKNSQSVTFVYRNGGGTTATGATLDATSAGAFRLSDTSLFTTSAKFNSTGTGNGTSANFAALAAGQASYSWKDSTQAADAKLWDIVVGLDANTLRFRAINDAENNAVTWLKATRNATTTVDADFTGSNSVLTSALKIGSSGTLLTKTVVYSQTITPASVAAATAAEQTFTVTGLTTADKVVVNPAATGNSTMVGAARVSAADTLAIQFTNPTAGALTPGSGTYNVIAFRS